MDITVRQAPVFSSFLLTMVSLIILVVILFFIGKFLFYGTRAFKLYLKKEKENREVE